MLKKFIKIGTKKCLLFLIKILGFIKSVEQSNCIEMKSIKSINEIEVLLKTYNLKFLPIIVG